MDPPPLVVALPVVHTLPPGPALSALPQELWDEVIDCFYASYVDEPNRSACSLVCKAFRDRSQRYILRELLLTSELPVQDMIDHYSDQRNALSKRYIKNIATASAPPQDAEGMAQVQNLLELFSPQLESMFYGWWPVDALLYAEPAYYPSLTTLYLSHCRIDPGSLTALLLHCPALEKLTLESLWGGPWEEVPAMNPGGAAVLPRLRRLQFTSAGSLHLRLGAWMVKTNAGVIEELHMPWLYGADHEVTAAQDEFLHHIGSTLRTLVITFELATDTPLPDIENTMFREDSFRSNTGLVEVTIEGTKEFCPSPERVLEAINSRHLKKVTLSSHPPEKIELWRARGVFKRLGSILLERFESFDELTFDLFFIEDYAERVLYDEYFWSVLNMEIPQAVDKSELVW